MFINMGRQPQRLRFLFKIPSKLPARNVSTAPMDTSKSFSLAVFTILMYLNPLTFTGRIHTLNDRFQWTQPSMVFLLSVTPLLKKDIVDDAELNDHFCLSRCSFQEATTIGAHHVRLKSHYTIRLSFFSHTINDNLMTTQPNLISFDQFVLAIHSSL